MRVKTCVGGGGMIVFDDFGMRCLREKGIVQDDEDGVRKGRLLKTLAG